MASPEDNSEEVRDRFSLNRLSAAFARLTGSDDQPSEKADVLDTFQELENANSTINATNEVLSPRMIVEGMLFVGNGEGQPFTNREMAANIRDVSPTEVDDLIVELNQLYESTGAPYEIVSEGAGYRMLIRPAFESLRQRFYGRVKEAKLTSQAIEVLSVVAYSQPITAEGVSKLRASQSRAVLNQLVRRGLLRMDRSDNTSTKPSYLTTDRFNQLFRIGSPQDLPNSEDLDDN